MQLYSFFRSGTSHRLRIALNLKGLATEYVAVDLRTEAHQSADYKALNPQGLVPTLVKDGQVTRGWIGVEPRPLNAELAESFGIAKDKTTGDLPKGVLINGVLQNSPAAKAGIQPGDLVMQVAGEGVSDVPEMLTRVAALKPGEAANLSVLRNGKILQLRVTPGVRPSRP